MRNNGAVLIFLEKLLRLDSIMTFALSCYDLSLIFFNVNVAFLKNYDSVNYESCFFLAMQKLDK